MATWNEMIKYLKAQDNCRVNGKGFYVLDLKKFVSKMEYLIDLHEPQNRSKNITCVSLKGSLTKVYEAHKTGSIQEANTINRNNFSIYSK
jgi:hypothetical protein